MQGEEMSGTNDTNMTVSGSGTASDPYTYNFHETAQSYGAPWMFFIVAIIVLGLAASIGFLLGFYFGNRRKKAK
jgi:hypothetical protein